MSRAETLLLVVFWIAVAVAVAVRLAAAIRRHQLADPAPQYARFTPPLPGARWLACDTTICGHMTTVHTPQPDGAYRCFNCGTTKGD